MCVCNQRGEVRFILLLIIIIIIIIVIVSYFLLLVFSYLIFAVMIYSSIGGHSEVDILIATPGRLMDHLQSTRSFTLQHLQFLVSV